jgi:dUTP pyrophosphatase
MAIPEGYAGLVLPRSGLAVRHGVSLVNTPGLIDSGYRGEIRVPLINHDRDESFRVEPGIRVAQLVLVRTASATFEEVEFLDAGTDGRGEGGFGSSGA